MPWILCNFRAFLLESPRRKQSKNRSITVPSICQFSTPRSIRLPVLLLRILSRILAPSQRASTQKGWHGSTPSWHSTGHSAGRLVAARWRGRGQRGRGWRNARWSRGWRMLAMEALQMREQPQSQGIDPAHPSPPSSPGIGQLLRHTRPNPPHDSPSLILCYRNPPVLKFNERNINYLFFVLTERA